MATQRAPKHDTGRADRVVNKVIELFRREAVQLGHLPPFFDGSAGCLIVSGCRCPSVRGDARETVELLDGRNRPTDRTMQAPDLEIGRGRWRERGCEDG